MQIQCQKFFNIITGLSVAILLSLTGCKEEKQVAVSIAPNVGVSKVIKKDVPLSIEAPAKITGSLEIEIRAQVGGILEKRTYNEGEYVEKDSKLFVIDQEPYKAALNRAKGSLLQAEADLKKAERDYARMSKLFKDGAVSRKDYDDATSAKERAIANKSMCEATLDEAEINLGYTEVRAPISGIVRKEALSVGNLISAGGLLTSMVQIDPLYANFSVSGATWSKLAKEKLSGKVAFPEAMNFKVEMILTDKSVYPEVGKIIFVDSNEDNFTSSITLKAEIPNKNNQKILIPGQFVRVKVTGAIYKDALVIPSSALFSSANGNIVFVLKEDNSIEARPVESELIGNEAMISNGLSEGERVVSEGLIKVRPGIKVNPVEKTCE